MHRRSFLYGLLAVPVAGAVVATRTVLDFETQARVAVKESHRLTLIEAAEASHDHGAAALIKHFTSENELLKALPWKEERL
jgi:hypothetical protein